MHDDAMDTLAAMLKPSDFYGEAHKILYSALLDRHERGLKCDCLTISHELGMTARVRWNRLAVWTESTSAQDHESERLGDAGTPVHSWQQAN